MKAFGGVNKHSGQSLGEFVSGLVWKSTYTAQSASLFLLEERTRGKYFFEARLVCLRCNRVRLDWLVSSLDSSSVIRVRSLLGCLPPQAAKKRFVQNFHWVSSSGIGRKVIIVVSNTMQLYKGRTITRKETKLLRGMVKHWEELGKVPMCVTSVE